MLIAHMSINRKLIDSILIHNTGRVDFEGNHIYELVNQNNKRITDTLVRHKRTDGYRKLLIKCLQIMEDENIENKPLYL